MLNITQILLSAFIGSISTLIVQFFLRNEDKKYKANLLRLENVYSDYYKLRNTSSSDDVEYFVKILVVLHRGLCYLDRKSQRLVAQLHTDVIGFRKGLDISEAEIEKLLEVIKISDNEYDKISKKLKLYKS